MVQKTVSIDAPVGSPRNDAAPKKRGRPRAYEPDVALGQAMDVFRRNGFAATSLDDLSAATGMNRPSLYGAFGDKRELYIKTYERYRADGRAKLADIFSAPLPLRERLQRIFAGALDIYLTEDGVPRGCFTLVTVASDAVADPEVRALVVDGIRELDKAFAACFRLAQGDGELPANSDPQILAQIASATLHTLSIRARAGLPRQELEALSHGALDLLCAGSLPRR